MDMASAEKCIRQLPPIRVSDSLETALMRLASADDRKLSEYVRLILERHVFGHGGSVVAAGTAGNESRA